MDGCTPLEEAFSGLMQAFSSNSLVKFFAFGDALICWTNTSMKRSGFLLFVWMLMDVHVQVSVVSLVLHFFLG